MGCDIHTRVEYVPQIPVANGNWFDGDLYRRNIYYGYEGEPKFTPEEIISVRDYDLFAVLANVRNYSKITPISKPRGVPDDVSKEVKGEIRRWGRDGHSHSYFTLAELKEWLKTNGEPVMKYKGWVTKEVAEQIDSKGTSPFDAFICGSKGDKFCEYREWQEERKLLAPIIEQLEVRAKALFFRYTPELDDKIRIVFWFDN